MRGHDVRGRHLVRRPAAEERQRVLRLVTQEFKHLRDARVAALRKAEDDRASDEDGPRPEREGHDDVGPRRTPPST